MSQLQSSTDSPEIDQKAWIRAIDDALAMIARDTLGLDGTRMAESQSTSPAKGIRGAYISLVDGEVSVLIGLRSSGEDCERLTRYMMAMEDDEPVEDEDVTGVVAEIVNIVAGVVKSSIGEAELRLGIPMVVSGRVTPANQQEVAFYVVEIGEAKLEVLLLHRRKRPRGRLRKAS